MTVRRAALALVMAGVLALAAPTARAEGLLREPLRIATPEAGPSGLEAMLVRPDSPGRYPLVLLSHGAPRKPEERKGMSPLGMTPIAEEFARRGFAAVVAMRRGYGESGGSYAESSGACDNPDYVRSARISAADLKAAIRYLGGRSDIDTGKIIAAGQSAGGLATVALAAEQPAGLVAAINFAGGRGSPKDFTVCREERLIAAFATFGKTARVPMLWVYTDNDHYFAPPLAEKFRAAFAAAGGNVEFIKAPAFGKDGHGLFSLNGIATWTPLVDAFLARHGLQQRTTPIALPRPNVTAPANLSARGREAFETYLRGSGQKAFAVSRDGGFGWQTGKRRIEDAKDGALKFCRGDKQRDCAVVFINDTPVR